MTVLSPLAGIQGYNQANQITESAQPAGNLESFSGLVNQSIEQSTNVLRASEQAALGAMTGTVSVDELSTAIANAENTLRTVVAIRDRVISAYQDIIKMPV